MSNGRSVSWPVNTFGQKMGFSPNKGINFRTKNGRRGKKRFRFIERFFFLGGKFFIRKKTRLYLCRRKKSSGFRLKRKRSRRRIKSRHRHQTWFFCYPLVFVRRTLWKMLLLSWTPRLYNQQGGSDGECPLASKQHQ